MRKLPSALTVALLFAACCPSGLAQYHAKKTSVPKSYGPEVAHRKGHSDIALGGHAQRGLSEELSKIEHQPVSESSVAAARTKPAPRAVPLPKLDSERKTGKSGAIKVNGSHSQKAMTATRRSSGSATPRIH